MNTFWRWARVFAIFFLAAIVPRAMAQIPKPVVGSSVMPIERAAPSQGLQVPIFEFRSGFWVNLNHFLYLQARLQSGLAVEGGAAAGVPAQDWVNPGELPASERQPWQNAVDYYMENFAAQDLPYDSFLVRIDERLSDVASCADLTGRSGPSCAAGIDPGLEAILEEAAPVYREHWWTGQNKRNQAWILQTAELVRQYGDKPAEGLSQAFNNTWPTNPIPVDVVSYAGAFGAYETLDPLHIFLASGDPLNRGFAALETIFRESSHFLAEPVQQAIIQQCHEQTKPVPRDLWHALVSYTTATVFEQSFAGGKLRANEAPTSFSASNLDYMTAHGWQSYQQLIERYWQPYLDNQTGMQTAIMRIVGAL